jgi:hypothetical protein
MMERKHCEYGTVKLKEMTGLVNLECKIAVGKLYALALSGCT